MNVQVNIKAATARMKSFLAKHGGTAKHSEVLELVAGMCGFDSYRAMKAGAKPQVYDGPILGGIRATTWDDKYEARTLEDEKHVVFRSTAVDWQLGQDPTIGLDEVPEVRRQKYDVVMENYGCQFRLLLKPAGVGLDNFDGKNVLDMLIEVNEGVPCVHLTNDPADATLVSIFATAKGLLVRPDDGVWMCASNYGVPTVLKELAAEACGEDYVHNAYVALLDTAEKYRDDSQPVEAIPLPAGVAAQPEAIRELPHARSVVECPVSRRFVGSYVTVVFDRNADSQGKRLGVDVSLFDVDGVPGDDDMVVTMSTFPVDSPFDTLHSTARHLADLVSFFVAADYSMGQLRPMILSVVEAPEPLTFIQELSDLVYHASDKFEAFKVLTLKVGK